MKYKNYQLLNEEQKDEWLFKFKHQIIQDTDHSIYSAFLACIGVGTGIVSRVWEYASLKSTIMSEFIILGSILMFVMCYSSSLIRLIQEGFWTKKMLKMNKDKEQAKYYEWKGKR